MYEPVTEKEDDHSCELEKLAWETYYNQSDGDKMQPKTWKGGSQGCVKEIGCSMHAQVPSLVPRQPRARA